MKAVSKDPALNNHLVLVKMSLFYELPRTAAEIDSAREVMAVASVICTPSE